MSEVDELVNAHNRDELNELAVEAGVENPESLGSKAEVAQAIVDASQSDLVQSDSGAADEASLEVLSAQNLVPGSNFPGESVDELRERTFERDFGHLEGEELDNARSIIEANWRLEDEINSLPGYIGG